MIRIKLHFYGTVDVNVGLVFYKIIKYVSESTLSQSNEIHPVIASRKAIIQAQKVMRLPEFQYAASVAERLLASNTFLNQQISFMDSIRDPQGTL